ncbi:MAG: class I SAM-dependent methyltransferase [Jatrophihabitans sp.]
MDWQEWHQSYQDNASSFSRRLAIIQSHIDTWLDTEAPAQPVVLSICAGDGRDLLQVLADREDRDRVSGVLIEWDGRLSSQAQDQIAAAGLHRIEVRCSDAGAVSAYTGALPADLVILAGVFGNISDADVRKVIRQLPAMCRPGARVIWTRHRNPPDLTGAIRGWLLAEHFAEKSFTAPEDAVFSVGVADYVGPPVPWDPPNILFSSVSYGDCVNEQSTNVGDLTLSVPMACFVGTAGTSDLAAARLRSHRI